MAISVTMVASNCDFLDYSLEAAIRSSLNFADEVVVNEGMSFDTTYDYKLMKYIDKLDKFEGLHPAPIYKWFASRNRLLSFNPETDSDIAYGASPFKEGKDFIVERKK